MPTLTQLVIRNFKLFEEVELKLADRVIFIGPNNSGKTSALQALALWSAGVRRWVEKRGAGSIPEKRAGVTISRRDLIAVPVPSANLLWRDLHVREGYREADKTKTRNLLIEIDVDGIGEGKPWETKLEFDYANEESFYCRSRLGAGGVRLEVPAAASEVRLAYLPPMSGLAANETRLDEGAIDVRIGEGRTAEVLRNLCWRALQRGGPQWEEIVAAMDALFGVRLDEPVYVKERGEIVMSFRTPSGVTLDLSASGRGQEQTLLLLAHMAANPGAILLLDEPDAHLEILRQRQIYRAITEAAEKTGSQIIAASHSEVILNEAADRDAVIAFVGSPHRIDDRGAQLQKALREVGFDQYYQAEEHGWVLYLEGSTDLAILQTFASILNHPAQKPLARPFVHYVGNQPRKAQEHFYALRYAKPDLVGLGLYDRLDGGAPQDPNLPHRAWARRELENYLCDKDALLAFACAKGAEQGELFGSAWRTKMSESIEEIEAALLALGKPSPWGPDIKASDDFLDPLFKKFYEKLGLPNLTRKADYHAVAHHLAADKVAPEIRERLDELVEVAGRARPRRS